VGDYITPDNRGRVMGLTLALEYLGSIVGGVATGYIYAAWPHGAFLFSSVILFGSAIPLLFQVLAKR